MKEKGLSPDKFITILSWMVTDLHLSGHDLMIYAMVYGFSQDNKSEFFCSLSYISAWTGLERSSVIRHLKYLVEIGYLEKREEPGKTSKYVAITTPTKIIPVANCNGLQNATGVVAKCNGGGSKMQPDIYNYNNKENIIVEGGADAPALNTQKEKKEKNKRPTLEEVTAYCKEKGYTFDPGHFFDHFTSNGWKVSGVPMVDWKAAVRNWARNEIKFNRKPYNQPKQEQTAAPAQPQQQKAAPVKTPEQIAEEKAEAERRAYFDKKMEEKRIREEAAYRASVEAKRNHSFRPAARLNLQTQEQ